MKPRTSDAAKGLTAFGRSVATAGAGLLLLGLAFGNYPYILCALLLLGAALGARGLKAPTLLARRRLSSEDLWAGEVLTVDIDVEPGAPVGLTLHERTPDPFVLAGGSNFAAAWLPRGARMRYQIKAPRRGAHDVGALRATTYDPLFLQSALVADALPPQEVVVHPRTPAAPRIRTRVSWGRAQLPGGDRATRGILTNDFRELRPYERGDPLRQVNWKATARMSRENLNLIVNDYEVEGKKAVWIFCDASPYTVGGTTSESTFDELASGSLAVAGHYIAMGHRVGFTLYGAGVAPRLLYPDSGDLQERRIAALLATVDPAEMPEAPGETRNGIAQAVEATKGFIVREKPLIFAFTLAGRDPELPQALVSARALATPGRRPSTVVAVTPYEEAEASMAARLVALREQAQLKGLERRGITVLRYHPTKAPLMAILARGGIR